jgi:hypothetical protein
MSRFRGRLRRLRAEAEGETTTLVCPECGEEFVTHGDSAAAYLVYQWRQGYEGETYGPPIAPAVGKLAEHEHDPSLMIDKADGLPWLGQFFHGMGQIFTEGVEDLSEP